MRNQFSLLQRAFFCVGFCVLASVLLTTVARGQATTAPDKPPLKQEELDQLVAPIALYPDSLLSQILMASTYPLEIVQADRWVKANKDLKDPQLSTELEKQTWDPSVKSLINFPQVLAMMSEKLDLTMKLGDAFIEQQTDVMNTVQNLRAKAQGQGNLNSNEQQKVVVEAAPAVAQATVVVDQVTPAPEQIIRIEQTDPQVIYVPSYSPTVVYGTWPYPAYPPAPYYPPGYVASNIMSFGLGVACGAAWGYAWGNCNWGGGDIDIDVNKNNNFNRNNNNSRQNFQNRQNNNMQGGRGNGQGGRGNSQGGRGSWQHNPSHRGAVPYRDNKTSQRFGGGSSGQAARARDSYRGRSDAGRQDLSRGGGGGTGVQNNRAGSNAGNRQSSGASVQNRAGSSGQSRQSPGASVQNRSGSSSSGQRSQSSASRGGGLSGVDRGGSAARSASQRGQSSRSSSPSRSRGSSGGGSRGGGGGGRRGGGGGRR